MADNNDTTMNQPLTGGGGGDSDSVSHTSQSSRSRLSGSLLERIQAQRSREQMQQQQQQQGNQPTPSQITIPNYGPPSQPNVPQRQQSTGEMNDFGILSEGNGWGGTSSMMMGTDGGGVSSEALLGNQQNPDSQYSMGEYFKTFVMDIYNMFRSLPIWLQIPLLILMFYLVIKWI